jgi:predicted nicotinamide N-methyase
LQVEEVDWTDVHAQRIKGNGRSSYANEIKGNSRADTREQYDLIVAVDCIYNEALIPPFVSTLEYYTAKGKTLVMVVCELRSVEVVSTSLALAFCNVSSVFAKC